MANWRVNAEPDPLDGELVMPRVVVPELCELNLQVGGWTEYGRWLMKDYKPIAGAASIGDAVELKVLDHLVANATYGALTPYLGLWTSALTDASTSATAGELSYT